MRTTHALVLGIAVAAWAPLSAAQNATITSSVNVRSGPDRMFPTVTWLLTGAPVTVAGCTSNWRWCDVIAGRDRGWVYARYLSHPLDGSAVTIIRGGSKIGLPQTEFSLGPYWDEHYQGKRWFAEKAQWQRRWDQRPPARD